jgi:hypothetical protein
MYITNVLSKHLVCSTFLVCRFNLLHSQNAFGDNLNLFFLAVVVSNCLAHGNVAAADTAFNVCCVILFSHHGGGRGNHLVKLSRTNVITLLLPSMTTQSKPSDK